MADDKKPKIDLKARLGKTSAGGATPAPGGGVPVPIPVPTGVGSSPTPGMPQSSPAPSSGQALPGVPVGGPAFGRGAIDPSNPLAAVASPYAPQPAAPAQPVAPARIEVDEMAVQQARSGARKQGFVIALIVGLMFGGIGYTAGGARETSKAREKSMADAVSLADDVEASKTQLESLAKAIEEGRDQLVKERKFPTKLSHDLGGIRVDFDGSKLAGRRFSGVSSDVTTMLFEFITAVQSLNDRKELVQGLLARLEKPLTEQFAAPPGQQNVQFVVILDKDPVGNPTGILAPLSKPISFVPPKVDLPKEFAFSDTLHGGNKSLPQGQFGKGDTLKAPSAVYVLPKTFEAVCPSEEKGQVAQLGAQLSGVVEDIRGEGGPKNQDIVRDTKPGLIELAVKLADGLRSSGKK